MTTITTYAQLEDFGRTRLSQHFFMRDFLHSEIAAWYGLRNLPDDPQRAIYAGSRLCAELLEPLQATFGRIHVRSGYRSPEVNALGNRNRHNCASNESNHAAHIWDHPDANGHYGATACIVIPWLLDHIEHGGNWTDMAWWIHDHLPYGSMYFFTQLTAFNIRWHEAPARRVDSYAPPKGCLIRPGTPASPGLHAEHYQGFPALRRPTPAARIALPARPTAAARPAPTPITTTPTPTALVRSAATTPTRPSVPAPAPARQPVAKPAATALPAAVRGSGKVHYRAIHTKNPWREVNSHQSLESAIHGPNGAQALFRGKVRINYATHGNPLYAIVWQDGASHGLVLARPTQPSSPMRMAEVPVAKLQAFDRNGRASAAEIESLLR